MVKIMLWAVQFFLFNEVLSSHILSMSTQTDYGSIYHMENMTSQFNGRFRKILLFEKVVSTLISSPFVLLVLAL